MEAALRKTGNFLALFFLLIAGNSAAQNVKLKSDVTTASPGDPITLSVLSNVKGHITIDLPLDFQPEYGAVRTSENQMDHATGKVEKNFILKQKGAFHKPGTYSFYAYVNYKGRDIQSNKITIHITNAGNPKDYLVKTGDPVYGIIQTKKKTVYEGEAVLISCKVVAVPEIFKVVGYNAFDFENNTERHPFQNQPVDFTKTTIKGKNVYVLEHDKQLIFPVTVGKNRVHPFEMSLLYHASYIDKQVTIKSAAALLDVKALPNGAPADFVGAVGDFGVSLSDVKKSIKASDPYTLSVVVSGRGNLHNITSPVLKLPNGCSVYGDPDRKESYVFTQEGVKGTITFTYDIKIIGGGDFAFPPQSISWFDPETEEYKTAETEGFTLNVKGGTASQANTPAGLKSKPKSGDGRTESGGNYFTLIIIIVIVLMAALLLIFLLNRKKPEKRPDNRIKLSTVENPVVKEPVKSDPWQEVTLSTSDPATFARLLPQVIIAEINRKTRNNFFSREKALSALAEDRRSELRKILESCDHFLYGTLVHISPIEMLQRAKKILEANQNFR